MEQHGVGADDVTRIVRKVVPAVVNDSLEGPDSAEQRCLAVVKSGKTETDREADAVNGDSFERVVVEGTVGEWHIDIVVH